MINSYFDVEVEDLTGGESQYDGIESLSSIDMFAIADSSRQTPYDKYNNLNNVTHKKSFNGLTHNGMMSGGSSNELPINKRYMIPLEDYPNLPEFDTDSSLRLYYSRMKTLIENVKEDTVCEITDVLERFNYFYGFQFSSRNNNFDEFVGSNTDVNYLIVNVLYPTIAYNESVRSYDTMLTMNMFKNKIMMNTKPTLEKGFHLKHKNISLPSSWKLIDNSSTQTKIIIKYDENHYELSVTTLSKRELEMLLCGSIIRTSQCVTLNDDKRIELIKMKHQIEKTESTIYDKINVPLKHIVKSSSDLSSIINSCIEYYEEHYNEFPEKISKGVDVDLFKVYINGFAFSDGKITRKMLTEELFVSRVTLELVKYFAAFF